MNEKLLAKIAQKELSKRATLILPNVLQDCLPYQLDFINNPAKRKAVCSTRRSAKSYCGGLYLVDIAVKTPKAQLAYLTLTNDSAVRIMWGKIIEVICLKYQIKAHLNSKREIEFDNGSTIYLVGLDATPKQMNRLRGTAYELVIMDECQDFTQDLEKIYKDVLKMTLAQTGATLGMLGTPGNQMGEGDQAHYWWKINRPNSQETEWKTFFFDWKQNTSIDPISKITVCDAINQEVAADIRRKPLIVKTDSYRREILGEWVIETDARVYRSKEINYIDKLPTDFKKDCSYILGMDLGFIDATAYVIAAYNKRFNDSMYVLESVKHPGLTVTAAVNILKEYRKKYNFKCMVVDAGAQGKMIVEEMRQIHNMPLIPAEKHGKEGHIALMNSDFMTENMFVIKTGNEELIKELNTVIWDPKALMRGKHKEDERKENHLTDALLYAHFYSRHYWYRAPQEKLPQEEVFLQNIEKQFEQYKPKNRYLRKSWWEEME